MGLTYIDGLVSGPSGAARTVRFLVDGGAKYSLLPLDDWRALGLTPMRRATFVLADGTQIDRDIAECRIARPQGEGHSPVILFYEEWQRPERSSPIFAEEIRDTGWDYVALGHQHVQTDVSQGRVAAWYAGAPMIEWGSERPEGSVLRIDFSEEDGIRVIRYWP